MPKANLHVLLRLLVVDDRIQLKKQIQIRGLCALRGAEVIILFGHYQYTNFQRGNAMK